MYYPCCENPYPHIALTVLVQRNAPALFYTVQLPIIGEISVILMPIIGKIFVILNYFSKRMISI